MHLLSNKTVLVTGATSGIGRASALLFAQEGALVAVSGRRIPEGEAVVAEITKAGGEAVFFQANVAEFDMIEPMMDRLVQRLGRLDGVFNNAGVGGGRRGIAEPTSQDSDTLFDTNLKAAYFNLQAQVKVMRRQGGGGSIVFNSSVLASMGFAGTAMYSASKGGVLSLARAAAVELGPEGIRVNVLSPSITRTEMTQSGYQKQGDGTEQHPFASLTPLRRTAEPIEIAEAALFLLSARSSFITGHNLVVDGGISAA
jgi:NAD(P)-dependent dehydrogenase (short-subunit alcohol dehydrogenase family)